MIRIKEKARKSIAPETAASGLKRTIQWNLDLTKSQGTREIDSLYRGPVSYI